MAETPKNRKRFWWEVGIVATVIVVAIAILLPNTGGDFRRTNPRNACINNLRQIDGAIEQWVLDKKIPSGDPVVDAEVATYIKYGMPKCPSGGKYTIGKAGEPPRCSMPGHVLPRL